MAFFLVCFWALFINFSYANCSDTFSKSSLNRGYKTQHNWITVLNLQGSYCDMGRQYGHLVGRRLQNFHQSLHHFLIKEQKKNEPALIKVAQTLFRSYPERYKDLLRGMAQTSGLSLNQHIFLNAFEHILYYDNLEHQPGCSSIALWKANTKEDHQLLFGRNYDYFLDHPEFKEMLGITVFHPAGGEIPTAIITFLGTLNATTNLNEKGLFLQLNNAYPSAKAMEIDTTQTEKRYHTTTHLLTVMFDSASLEDLDTALRSYYGSHPFIINVADKNQAYSYEWTPEKIIRLSHEPGLLVSTNHFLSKDWAIQKSNNLWQTLERHHHLFELGQRHKEHISILTMQAILSKTIEQGGATTAKTIYQVIADPGQLHVWIASPGYAPYWQAIDLKPYLRTHVENVYG